MGPPLRGPIRTQGALRAQSAGARQQRPQQSIAGSSGSVSQSSRVPVGAASHWRRPGSCYGCGVVGHHWRDCPQNPNKGKMQSSEPTIGDMARSHRIYAAVENHQAEHQSTVIETTGSVG
ncbi:hypothetical protein KI387_014716, partial [Taxus chinensis]